MRRLGVLSALAGVAGGVQRGGTGRAAPDEIRKNPAKEEAIRATTHHAVLLIMAALFVLAVLAFGAMLALDYGLFAPAEETMITPEVLAAYLDELVDRPLESFEYSFETIYSGHMDLTSTVGTSPFP
jgi:hypothetical protein